jgi:S-disulfanyl-L-cysteine oxidoreductase SoxD
VYAVTAFLLNLGGVVPDGFTLSHNNMAEAQARMPNRNGMTTDHGLWPGAGIGSHGKPDVKAVACMKNCSTEPAVASFLPDFARNAHGNLLDQNRLVGAQRGAQTAAAAAAGQAISASPEQVAQDLAKKHLCLSCHGVENKVVGPALRDVAKKYASRTDALDYLKQRIVAGGAGVWGPIPMPAQTLPGADLQAIAKWLSEGAK